MSKKIDNAVREHVRTICYEAILFEQIDHETRKKVKEITENYLNNNGYKIERVVCDESNNPPDIVDSRNIKLEIWEETIPGSKLQIFHTIML